MTTLPANSNESTTRTAPALLSKQIEVRCSVCGARLFDVARALVACDLLHADIEIKCRRCRAVMLYKVV